ncbi:MAG TPA: M24 family metallopeptidase [Chloroflexota bacterium]|jgi:Xaa-Pro aminopeptidase
MAGEHEYPRFSDAEFARRQAAVRERLAAAELDALVVHGRGGRGGSQLQYLTNWPAMTEAYLLFPRSGEPALWVHHDDHLPLAQRASLFPNARGTNAAAAATLAAALRERGLAGARLGLAGPLRFRPYERLQALLPDARWTSFNQEFDALFLVKSDEELAWLRRAAALGDRALVALEREVCPGLTEHDLAAIVQGTYRWETGHSIVSFTSMQPMRESAVPAPTPYPVHRRLQRGDLLTAEVHAEYWGYRGQSLRPYAIGEEPPADYQRLYEVAEAAFHAVAAALRTGAAPADVVAAADLIEDAGYTIHDDLVHGIGNGYLPPVLRTRGASPEPPPADFRYPENSTWVIQPNVITRDGRMAVNLGDMVRVTARGAERLSSYPLRLTVCGQ